MRVLVVAPHPDDETLGCGATLARHIEEGDEVHWMVATQMVAEAGFGMEQIASRERELESVVVHYGFAALHRLGLPAAQADQVPLSRVVAMAKDVVAKVQPHIVYMPHPADAHSDHHVVFNGVAACLKWFRAPYVQRVLAYETLSETGFGFDVTKTGFRPNYYVDVEGFLTTKLSAMRLFAGEMGTFPFPRSVDAIEALARTRGAESGFAAAEAFELLRERVPRTSGDVT